jgi:hypothetical protein
MTPRVRSPLFAASSAPDGEELHVAGVRAVVTPTV